MRCVNRRPLTAANGNPNPPVAGHLLRGSGDGALGDNGGSVHDLLLVARHGAFPGELVGERETFRARLTTRGTKRQMHY